MIKCYLSRILGERRINIADLARMTGINRGTITRLYNEETVRVELDVINTLCEELDLTIADLFEYFPDKNDKEI